MLQACRNKSTKIKAAALGAGGGPCTSRPQQSLRHDIGLIVFSRCRCRCLCARTQAGYLVGASRNWHLRISQLRSGKSATCNSAAGLSIHGYIKAISTDSTGRTCKAACFDDCFFYVDFCIIDWRGRLVRGCKRVAVGLICYSHLSFC